MEFPIGQTVLQISEKKSEKYHKLLFFWANFSIFLPVNYDIIINSVNFP